MQKLSLILLVLAGLLVSGAKADNWSNWRGPDANSVASGGAYPTSFSDEKNLAWKVKLPGKGSSTPAVWQDQIFVTSGNNGEDSITSYDWGGKQLWQKMLGPERAGKHKNGSGSNPSPITDGENVMGQRISAAPVPVNDKLLIRGETHLFCIDNS